MAASSGSVVPGEEYPMMEMDEAIQLVIEAASEEVEVEEVAIMDAVGRVLMDDVVAKRAHPPFAAAISDGYAICLGAENGQARKVGKVLAGSYFESELKAGECVYLATGAPLPQGADRIIKIERCREKDDVVYWTDSVRQGADIRPIGSDHKEGEILVAKGRKLQPWDLGLAAMAGYSRLTVAKKPAVLVISTGDELVDTYSESYDPRCQVIDTNRIALISLFKCCGFEASDGGLLRDDYDALLKRLQDKSHQVIVTTGGGSVGEADFSQRALSSGTPNGQLRFGRLNMKPGKPTSMTKWTDGTLLFALPGNPVSALVTAQLLVLPALRRLERDPAFMPQQLNCVLSHDVSPLDTRPEFRRVSLTCDNEKNQIFASDTGFQRSSRLTSFRGAQALACLPDRNTLGANIVSKNTQVPVILLEGQQRPFSSQRKIHFFSNANDEPKLYHDHRALIISLDSIAAQDTNPHNKLVTLLGPNAKVTHEHRNIHTIQDALRQVAPDVKLVLLVADLSLKNNLMKEPELLCPRRAPGLERAMARALKDPLQRPWAGILRDTTLLLALPSSPSSSAALTCLQAVLPALPTILSEL